MPRVRARDDTYWCLTYPHLNKTQLRTKLTANGYKPASKDSRNDLIALLRKHDTGSIHYSTCSNTELRRFAIERGFVKVNETPTLSRDALIKMLQKADAERTFHSFTSPPPELRARVYDCYFVDLAEDGPLCLPVDPPLTRASRLLRTEALPVFFKVCTFRLIISEEYVEEWNFCQGSRSWIKGSGDQKMSMMRRFEVDFISGARGPKTHITTAAIAIREGDAGFEISVSEVNVKNRSEHWKTTLKNDIKATFSYVLGQVMGDNGEGGKLEVKDVLALRGSLRTTHLAFSEFFPNGPIR